MGKILFISDLHFGHKNILAFDNRPFLSIEQHDNEIINKWNKKVKSDDTVWILGDVSWLNPSSTNEILNKLQGNKCLCIGNHDNTLLKNAEFRNKFQEICHYKELTADDGKQIVLCHYPILCYNNHHIGAYHLYGHVHMSYEYNIIQYYQEQMRNLYLVKSNMYNVGSMMPYMNYVPQTLEEIINSNKKVDE